MFTHFWTLWCKLETKVGWVLKEHKKIHILGINGWENEGQSCLPPSKKLHFRATHCRFSSFACAKIKSYKTCWWPGSCSSWCDSEDYSQSVAVRIFEWGFKRNRPKSWQWKQEQWKPIIVWLLWTLISQAWNGLLRHFQCLKSSAGNPLAV